MIYDQHIKDRDRYYEVCKLTANIVINWWMPKMKELRVWAGREYVDLADPEARRALIKRIEASKRVKSWKHLPG